MVYRNIYAYHLIAWLTLPAFGTGSLLAGGWSRFGGPNGDFKVPAPSTLLSDEPTLYRRWQVTLGEGLSSVTASEGRVYATYLEAPSEDQAELPEADRTHTEVVAALDSSDGRLVWQYRWDAGWLSDQEAFGGKSRAPQATPLVYGDRVIVLGFTGWLHCLDRDSGDLVWQANLVERFDAVPVQFGFSSSPIIHNERLILLAGGLKGGLVAMSLDDGATLWNVPCEEASYATPTLMEVDDESQIVFVTRIDVVGVDAENGTPLWRYELPKPGMTNVPTPMPLGDGRLAISGQGVGGTIELVVSRDEGSQWRVRQGWESRTEFFYCNWLLSDQRIVGCNNDLMVALDAVTGERVARWRGFSDANVISWGDKLVVVDGEGAMSFLSPADGGLEVLGRYQAIEERCWAPITIADSRLFCRGGDQLVCLELREGNDSVALEPMSVRRNFLAIKATTEQTRLEAQPAGEHPVDQIVARFEESGTETAWEEYKALRKNLGMRFTLDDREELAKLAMEQGLIDFGKQLLRHAVEDFGSEEARALQATLLEKYERQPSPETWKGKNGLLYVEIGVRNRSKLLLQTVVRGPAEHPFSYGIPFPFGKLRIEKWPVGTKLYKSDGDALGEVLVTVDESSSGKVFDIGKVQ